MKNSSLEKLKSFEIPRSITKNIYGGTEQDLENCITTAIRDENFWLIPDCYIILGDIY